MANINFVISTSFKDIIGVPASLPLYGVVADTVTVAQVITDLNTLRDQLHAISDDGIVNLSLGLLDNVSSVLTPGADSVSEQGLNLSFDQSGSNYAYGVWIPSLKDALIVDGHVDMGDAAITDFQASMVTGLTYLDFTSPYGNTLVGLINGAESFRKLRRRADKLTKAPAA